MPWARSVNSLVVPMAELGFGTRLQRAIADTSPLCVGLDPSAALLEQWGLPDTPGSLVIMGESVIEAALGQVAAIKPQVAYFERHGSQGLAALEHVLALCRDAGLLSIADAKRGDIDATMTAYGQAWVGQGSALRADAVTVVPYMGLGAMESLFIRAEEQGAGIFCVVASSNVEGRAIQTAMTGNGSVEATLLADLGARNQRYVERSGESLGPYGAVIGATREAGTLTLSTLGGCFLVPGFGAQGASASDVGSLFAGTATGSVLVNSARQILTRGPAVAELAAEIFRQAQVLRDALN